MHCHHVHGLSAAEALYHICCYYEFSKIPLHGLVDRCLPYHHVRQGGLYLSCLYTRFLCTEVAQEELKHERVLDAYDWGLIDAEVEKYPHPLEDHCPHLYNPVTGQIVLTDMNVVESQL